MKMRMLGVIISLFVVILLTAIVLADPPTGADSVTKVTSSKRTNFNETVKTVPAEAGNVTELQINITKQTDHWQGYYGNISGTITLDNANNFTMYQWSGLADVGGNIFATEASSVTWTSIICANLSSNMSKDNCKGQGEECLNITEMENMFGMNPDDADGVDETFTSTKDITIDTVDLTNCPATNLYQNDSSQTTYWNETLLTVNDTETLIFAVNVEDDMFGFNYQSWDFQMIVGENEGAGKTYSFYVELV